LLAFVGQLWLISGVFTGIAGDWPVSLAFVGSCGALWTISGFYASFFGISAGFLGMERGRIGRKRAVEDGKMCR
jgi:hypothetical protein